MFKMALPIVVLIFFAGCAAYHGEEGTLDQAPIYEITQIGEGYYRVTEGTGMFENADIGSRKIGRVKAGEIVQVVDMAGAFAQIKHSDNAGWVLSDELEDTEAKSVVRTVGEIKVKASADIRSNDIAMLESGRLVTIKKRQGSWVYIKISENRGWIMAGVLEALGVTRQYSSPRVADDGLYWKVLKKSNLRSSPNVVSEILRLMPAGSSVRYISAEGDWIHVEYDGTVGYVHEDLVGPGGNTDW